MGSVTININGLTLCHKGSGGIAISSAPDVCKTPPIPVPIPYTNVAFSSTLANGTTTVTADGGNMCAINGSEFASSIGDEPGVAGGVCSSVNMKEATWITYSPNVKIEGQNACRLTDKMFMNHQNTVCMGGEQQAPLPQEELTPCEKFVEDLIQDWVDSKTAFQLGIKLLKKRNNTLSDAGGFKSILTMGGQGGAVSRHVYGHAGAVLSGKVAGKAVSIAMEGYDIYQVISGDHQIAEGIAEVADDHAARKVATVLETAMERRHWWNKPIGEVFNNNTAELKEELREDLRKILCEDKEEPVQVEQEDEEQQEETENQCVDENMVDAQQVIDGLTQRGLPKHVAEGICANMWVESDGLNLDINERSPLVEGSRGGYGLCQWTGVRRRELEAFAVEKDLPTNDLDFQLDFVMHEFQTSEHRAYSALLDTKTAIDATRICSEKYLRPGIPHMEDRLSKARELSGETE